MNKLICKRIEESIEVKQSLLKDEELLRTVSGLAEAAVRCLNSGGKLVLCGNGGSASDALHFAGEIVGRFQKERSPWPAVVLNADVATMTAIANDYGYDDVFARQAEGIVCPGDVLIGISTSGNSENVRRAVEIAKNKGATTAALLGRDGGKIGKLAEYPIVVRGNVTARIQECHILLIHILCELIENAMTNHE